MCIYSFVFLENQLRATKQLFGRDCRYFTGEVPQFPMGIEDDHIPFLHRGITLF